MKSDNKTESLIDPKPSSLIICEKKADGSSQVQAQSNSFSQLVSSALTKYFSSAPIVSSAEEIWEELFREIPAVILVDLNLRSMDALGLVRSLILPYLSDLLRTYRS